MLVLGIKTCIGCGPEIFRVRPHQSVTLKLDFLLKSGCYFMSCRLPEAYHLGNIPPAPHVPSPHSYILSYGVQRVCRANPIYRSCRRESCPAPLSLTSSRGRERVSGVVCFLDVALFSRHLPYQSLSYHYYFICIGSFCLFQISLFICICINPSFVFLKICFIVDI